MLPSEKHIRIMKAVVIFYSFGGFTKKLAEHEAKRRKSELIEVTEAKKRNIFTAVITGCPQAMKQRAVKLKEPIPNLNDYDTIIIATPIWANYPAPAFNSIVKELPKGKNIELLFTSGSGNSLKCRDAVKKQIECKGSWIVDIKDIRSAK